MAGRGKEITFRCFIGGVPFEQVPQEEVEAWRARSAERMGKAVSRYCTQHPEAWESLTSGDKDYVTLIPLPTADGQI